MLPLRRPSRGAPARNLTSQSGDAIPMLHTSSCMSSALTVICPRGCPFAYTSLTLAKRRCGAGNRA